MKVVAVIVTRNRRELLSQVLRAVIDQKHPVDAIVVVDNASEDGTPEMLRAEFPEVVATRLPSNEGATGGYYEGIRRGLADGADWLWLLDDDSVPRPDALSELVRFVDQSDDEPAPALLASRVDWTDGEPHPVNVPVLRRRDPEQIVRAVRRGLLPVRAVSWISLFLSREAVEREGMPKRQFFYQADDIEYTARLLRQAAGYLVPTSVVEHRTATRHTAVDDDRRFFYHVRNTVLMVRGEAWTAVEKLGLIDFLLGTTIFYLRANRFAPASVRNLLAGLKAGVTSAA